MGILKFGIVAEATERELIKFPKIGGNTKTILRIQRDHLPMLLLIFLLWAFHCGVGNVAGQDLRSTEAPPTLEVGLAPAGEPEVSIDQALSQVGDAPQRPPPPPPTPPAGQFQQFQQVLSSLRLHNYTAGAQYISDYLFLLPLGSTMFVPTNGAFDEMFPSPVGPRLAYQAIMQQLSFQQIILLPVGTRFATMIANNNTVIITSVAPYDFRLDNVRIVEGDICSSSTSAMQISCHGVDGFFNMTEWGRASLDQLAPVPAPAFDEPPIWELTAPTHSVESSPSSSPAPAPSPHGAPAKSGVASRAENRCKVFSVVFAYACLRLLSV